MKHVFLINPRAGKGDQTARLRALAERLAAAHGLEVSCLLTGRPGAAESLARRMTEYYTRRAGEALTPEQLCARTEVAAGVLLSLLEAWICGELTQPPEQLCDELERWICQAALGAAWKNQE